MPQISIIIPVYNTEKYLRECLDSILAQTLQDIEIIVVNDASPDHSQNIINEYVAKDTRIQCIVHPKNLGLGGSRNTGIAAATGSYIAFLDSDDWVESHCYATVIKQMEENGANLGIFGTDNFDEQGISQHYKSSYNFPYSSVRRISAQDIVEIPCIMWNKIFRIEDIQQDILRLPIHLKYEDSEFWFKYASWVRPLAIVTPEVLHHRRRHNDSITANEQVYGKDFPQILLNIYHYLEKEHLYSKYYDSFKVFVFWSLGFYRVLSTKYQQRYCYEMCQLFKLCKLTPEDVLLLDSGLAIYYIKEEVLRQYFFAREQQIQQERQRLQQNRWYRFGQLSRKRKLWTLARGLSERLGMYRLLRPLAKIAKGILEKG